MGNRINGKQLLIEVAFFFRFSKKALRMNFKNNYEKINMKTNQMGNKCIVYDV